MNYKSALIASSLVTVGMLAISLSAWGQIPDTQPIPVHYGINGTPDRFGSKFEGLLVLPGVAIALTLLFMLLHLIEPRAQNLVRSGKAYAAVWIVSITFLAVIHVSIVLHALGQSVNLFLVVRVGMGVLFTVMGNYLGKIRSNFTFGIRTPWTLTSERSWNQTHRLGGRLFFLLGTGFILSAFVGNRNLFVLLLLGGTSVITLTLVIYSYLVWRTDPEKQMLDR